MNERTIPGVREAIIGLDIGTTNVKAAIFDLTGHELAFAESACSLSSPQPGWFEQDPDEVWSAVLLVLRTIIADAGADVRPISMAIASQSGSLVPADMHGQPVYPCITWMDGRSESLAANWVKDGLQERVRAISGWNIHPGLPLATISWLREYNPAVFASAKRWLCMNDYIAYRLTGQFAMNPSNGGVTQLMQADRPQWSVELCAMAGARPEQFSPVAEGGCAIGRLLREVSMSTGLPADLQVISGGHDQSCTAVALAVWQPGQVLLACGTSWVVTGVVSQPNVSTLPSALDLNYHAIPNRWTVSQSLGGLGASLEWLVRLCWCDQPTRQERYLAVESELKKTQPGSDGLLFIPMSGGHLAPAGMQRGGFANMHLGHTRAHMARAIQESAAFELRLALESIGQNQMQIDTLSMVGGATRSSVWPGIIADVTGLPLRVIPSAHLPAVGAAILASVGCGVYADPCEAQQNFVQPANGYAPVAANRSIYEERLRSYRKYWDLLS